jgi:hypothetical protein
MEVTSSRLTSDLDEPGGSSGVRVLGVAPRLPEAHRGVRLEAAVWRDRGGVRHDLLAR